MIVAITTMIPETYVPRFRALAGLEPSLPLTMKIPITDAMMPMPDRTSGNIAAAVSLNRPPEFAAATAARVTAEMIDPT